MTEKLTPGQWRIGKNYGSVVSDTRPDGYFSNEELDKQHYGGFVICETCTEPNARAIAALPDLIEVCRELLQHASLTEHMSAFSVERARAALAKATGVEP